MHRFEKKYLLDEIKELVENEYKIQAKRDANVVKALGKMTKVFGKARIR